MKADTLRDMLAEVASNSAPRAQPSYQALAIQIRTLILSGRLTLGSELPSERTLADTLQVSRTTARAAYSELRAMGFIETSPGRRASIRLAESSASLTEPDRVNEIDLASGSPMPEADAFERLYSQAAEMLPAFLRRPNLPVAGIPELRELVAQRFCERGLATTPEQVLITPGALNGIGRLFDITTRPGGVVLVEQPTYPQAVTHITRSRRIPAALPLGASSRHAWTISGVRAAYSTHSPDCHYTIPDGHNPTGAVMDVEVRTALASIAARYGTRLIVDETTTELRRSTSAAVPPLASFSPDSSAITVGSLSKIYWPGLRVGWVRAEPDIIAALIATQGNEATCSIVDQLTAIQVMQNLPEVVALRSAQLSRSLEAATRALSQYWPSAKCSPGEGFTLWVKLPSPLATTLAMRASQQSVKLSPGGQFGFGEYQFHDHLRIPLIQPPEVIREGLRRTADALTAVEGSG